MILCDLCGESKKCHPREIEGKEYDICADCWHPLAAKLKGKGREKKERDGFPAAAEDGSRAGVQAITRRTAKDLVAEREQKARFRAASRRAKDVKLVLHTAAVAQLVVAPDCGSGCRGFKSHQPPHSTSVRSGDIGNRTFRRHRLHFWPEGVLQGLQSFFLQINIAEIVIHKTDQPDAVVDFFDTDGLSGKGNAEIDFLVIQAKTSAAGDHDGAVVERVVGLGNAAIRARGSRVDLGGTFHGESFVRPFVIELLQESVELGLLLQNVGARRTSGFFLQGQMHTFMTAVLLGMTGADAFNGDA